MPLDQAVPFLRFFKTYGVEGLEKRQVGGKKARLRSLQSPSLLGDRVVAVAVAGGGFIYVAVCVGR